MTARLSSSGTYISSRKHTRYISPCHIHVPVRAVLDGISTQGEFDFGLNIPAAVYVFPREVGIYRLAIYTVLFHTEYLPAQRASRASVLNMHLLTSNLTASEGQASLRGGTSLMCIYVNRLCQTAISDFPLVKLSLLLNTKDASCS